jgi:hypothetical protein
MCDSNAAVKESLLTNALVVTGGRQDAIKGRCRRGKSDVAKGDTHSFFRPENNTGGDSGAIIQHVPLRR